MFASLAYIVIDELHAFLGTERGRQVQSLLHRLETCVQHTIPRIGLSATLSDMRLTAEHLRPGASERVQIITSQAAKQELKIQLRGYRFAPTNNTNEAWQEAQELVNTDIAKHLYATLSGSDNLIFPNSRANVELYADILRRICEIEWQSLRIPAASRQSVSRLARRSRNPLKGQNPTRQPDLHYDVGNGY